MPDVTPEVRSEIDLSLSKMERIVMQQIAETSDRVALHAAMKHLVVTGNALLHAGKKALKVFPLDRYVIARDGEGNVTEIITKEEVDRIPPAQGVPEAPDGTRTPTLLVRMALRSVWPPQAKRPERRRYGLYLRQVKDGQHAGTRSVTTRSSQEPSPAPPLRLLLGCPSASTWPIMERATDVVVLRSLSGTSQSLEGLYKALVEGSAAASKVVFMVSPSLPPSPSPWQMPQRCHHSRETRRCRCRSGR